MQETTTPKPRRRWRPLRCLCLTFLLLVIIPLAALIIWASTGPHSISWLKTRVVAMANQSPELYRVQIEDVVVRFDGWRAPLAIHAVDSGVYLPAGQLVTHIPDIQFDLDYLALLVGKMRLDNVRISSPSLYLHRSDEGELIVGNSGAQGKGAISVNTLLAGLSAGDAQSSGGDIVKPNIFIEDATLRMHSDTLGQDVDIEKAAISLMSEEADGYALNAQLPIAFGEEFTLRLGGKVSDVDSRFDLYATFDDMPLDFLCNLSGACAGFDSLKATLKGRIDLLRDESADWPDLQFQLHLRDAEIGLSEWWEEAVIIPELELYGEADIDGKKVLITAATGQTKDFAINRLDGQWDGSTSPATIGLNAEIGGLPINDLEKYWPINQAASSREWAMKNVRDGMVPKADIAMKIEPRHHETADFPSDILKAHVQVKDATLYAVEGAPPLTQVNGLVVFTGDSMRVEVPSAKIADVAVSTINLAMPDLNAKGTPTNTSFSFSAQMGEAIALLEAPAFSFDDPLSLSVDAAQGVANGEITLAFDAFSGASDAQEVNWDAVTYDVDTTLKDVAYRGLAGHTNLDQFNATLRADNDSLSAQGEGIVNGGVVKATIEDSATKAARYELEGTVPSEALKAYGLDVSDYVEGPLTLKASVVNTPLFPTVEADVDASQAVMKIPELIWQKPDTQRAQIQINARPLPTEGRGIIDFDIAATTLQSKGQLHLDVQNNEVKQLVLDHLVSGETDVSGLYQPLQNGDYVELKGRSLDLRAHLQQEGEQSISNFPPLHLVADIERVLMAEGQAWRDVKGKLFCTTERCNSGDLSAKISEEGQFRVQILRATSELPRRFELRVSDAGAFLKSVDLLDSMEGGALSLTGSYDDSQPDNPFEGRFITDKFVLKNAPLFGRILNLASLPGLLDTLQGNGMAFDKFSSDIYFVRDNITFKNALMKGSSVGVSAEGDVNVANRRIGLDGTVIPAYALNSLVGEIPVVGDLLTGGEGKGLVGVNYKIEESYANPKITVNPLSALTPGFLRDIFGSIDDAEPITEETTPSE